MDVTLSDGTVLPKGTVVVAAAHPLHHDEVNYADPSVFDPFRFSRMREREGEGTKHQFVNTSPEYVAFGHGKHAWCVFYSNSLSVIFVSNFTLPFALASFSLRMRSRRCSLTLS